MFKRPIDPEKLVARIRAGDDQLRGQFVADSIPEIRRLVRRTVHSPASDQDDAFSLALEAFNQAIDRFNPDLQVPFFSYADKVMKNRLYDWCRRQKVQQQALVFTDCEAEDGTALEDRLADPQSSRISEDLEIEESLIQLEAQLQQFGLSLPRLVNHFPRHQDSQWHCVRIARLLAEDARLFNQLMKSRRLPGSELSDRCQVSVKMIEKNRASIIFLVMLLRSNLQVIQTYIEYFEKEAAK